MAPESRAVPKLSALLVVFTTGLALALIPVDLPASVVAPEHVETFAVLATAILVCALAWGTRRDLVSLLSPKNVRAVHALPTLCILASFVLLLPYISLAESLGLRFESVVETYSESGGVDLAMVSFMCVVVPFVEEIAFRGYTLRQLGRVMSAREALIVQAMLFAAVHVNVLSLPSHFLAGLALGWLRQRTGNLYPSILAHGAWNALVIAHDVARSSS